MGSSLRVLHLISGLGTGGAERMLTRLATRLDTPDIRQEVVSMTGPGTFGPVLVEQGVPVHDLGLTRGVPDPRAVWRLARLLRHKRPALLMTWLYHADLLGTVTTMLPGFRGALAWNLRCSDMDAARYARLTRVLARLSDRPSLVLTNSEAGRRHHESLGYRPRRWEVVPNGIDLDVFRPRPDARARLRALAGLPQECMVFGVVARVDPVKGHPVFLDAFARLRAQWPDVHAVLIGTDTASLPPTEGVVALGERRDVPELLPGLDVLVSPSLSEGFSNVVAEAMACAVPCVVTTAGDSALLVGETGRTVPPGDARALAEALDAVLRLSDAERRALGRAARERVERHWALSAVLDRYAALFREFAAA